MLADIHAGDRLAYFPEAERPELGARVGALGTWLHVEVPLTALSRESYLDLCAGGPKPLGTPIELQLERWSDRVLDATSLAEVFAPVA